METNMTIPSHQKGPPELLTPSQAAHEPRQEDVKIHLCTDTQHELQTLYAKPMTYDMKHYQSKLQVTKNQRHC